MLDTKDLMTTDVVSVDPDDSVHKAVSLMLKHRITGLPVVDASGRLLGIISEFDLLDLVWESDPNGTEVFHYMTRKVHTADEEDDLSRVAGKFRKFGIRRLPVVRHGRLVGIITRHDLLRAFSNAPKRAPAVALA